MEQQTMYVVKNEAGEYLTEFSDWSEDVSLAKIFRTVKAAKDYAYIYDGTVYAVTLTVSAMPL